MTELEKAKIQAIETLNNLCARCKGGVGHTCPVSRVVKEIENLHGIPVIVNSQLYHVVFSS